MQILLVALALCNVEQQPVIDIYIYIYETKQKDLTTTFYSWISIGDCEIDGTVPEICIGWLQCDAIYLENNKKGLSGSTMFLVTIAERDDNYVYGGSGKPTKIWFGKLDNGKWDGKIYIEIPYKSTYKIRRTTRVVK